MANNFGGPTYANRFQAADAVAKFIESGTIPGVAKETIG